MNMTSFVHIEYPTSHPGVERFESAVAAAAQLRKGFDGTKGLAAVLLAAMVSALVVVADQLVDSWADGHLMAAWVLLWVLAFGAMALLAPTTKRLSSKLLRALDGWSRSVARARADDRLWAMAQQDPRVMADLRAAMTRAESDSVTSVVTERQVPVTRVAREAQHIWYM
jgi:hypothetical protein